ncbi:hypothetical protein FRC07_007555 [Ceratobasidium sp. 392]|nr:hypothetical protein FRC07_007555 [Ceratobasidium sp. 392]
MLLLSLATILVEVVLTVTSSPSLASGLSSICFEDIITRVQVAALVYVVVDGVFIHHAPIFNSAYGHALSAIAKIWTGATQVLSLKVMLYTGVYAIKALRAVIRLLAILLFPLLEPSLLLARGVLFALIRLTWDSVRRGTAWCILFTLSALVRLTRSTGMYGYAALTGLWKRRRLSPTLMFLLDQPCDAWSAPRGALVYTAVDEANDERGGLALPATTFEAQEDRMTDVALPPKEILSRREALSAPLGCTDPLTVTGNKANVEPNEPEQATAAISTTNDSKSIPKREQSEATLQHSDVLAPSVESNSSILSSATETTLDLSTTTLYTTPDTTLDLSLSSPPTDLSMSCELFKVKAAPQPKSLPELPVWLPPNHDVSPLTEQLEKITICAPDPEETDNEVHSELKTAKTGAETQPYDVRSTVLPAEDAMVGLGNSDQVPKRTGPRGVDTTVENVVSAATDNSQAMAGTAISRTGTPTASLLDDPLHSLLPDDARTPSPSPAKSGTTTPDSENDGLSLSYFEKGKWLEVDVNEARRELALAGAPMMSTTPGTSRTSAILPAPEVIPRLDEETERLLAQCDEFGYIADEEWTDGSEDGSSTPSPGSEQDRSIADSPKSDTAQTPVLPDPARDANEMDAKKPSQGTKRVRSSDEEEDRVSKRRPQHRDELGWLLAN